MFHSLAYAVACPEEQKDLGYRKIHCLPVLADQRKSKRADSREYRNTGMCRVQNSRIQGEAGYRGSRMQEEQETGRSRVKREQDKGRRSILLYFYTGRSRIQGESGFRRSRIQEKQDTGRSRMQEGAGCRRGGS